MKKLIVCFLQIWVVIAFALMVIFAPFGGREFYKLPLVLIVGAIISALIVRVLKKDAAQVSGHEGRYTDRLNEASSKCEPMVSYTSTCLNSEDRKRSSNKTTESKTLAPWDPKYDVHGMNINSFNYMLKHSISDKD